MEKVNERKRNQLKFGFKLALSSTRDGWDYEWRDPTTGRVIAQGWSRGTRREGEQEAVRDLVEKGYGR